jgi:23S rRNA (adenine1618-N6)-methyltransferase
MADLMTVKNYGKTPVGSAIKCLDVGVGANCIYPIIGTKEYDWSFIGTDVDPIAIDAANKIITMNPRLKDMVELRLQSNPQDILFRIIHKEELIDITICNPPFHTSLAEAQEGTLRKLNNLNPGKPTDNTILNFGGQHNELWCKGGEVRFVKDMVRQSKPFKSSCFWFSTLISKQSHLSVIYEALKKAEVSEVRTIPMGQGNKTSRIVAWTFLSIEEQKHWANKRWK